MKKSFSEKLISSFGATCPQNITIQASLIDDPKEITKILSCDNIRIICKSLMEEIEYQQKNVYTPLLRLAEFLLSYEGSELEENFEKYSELQALCHVSPPPFYNIIIDNF
jgi:hypothetical protein